MSHQYKKLSKFNQRISVIVFFGFLGLLSSPFAVAEVNDRNGNYLISSVDFEYKGGLGTSIVRAYNSKSNFRGMFGWGWGSAYDAYVTTESDGTLLVHEYGGGAENRFVPLNYTAATVQSSVDTLADLERKSGGLGTPAQLQAFKKKLFENPSFRNEQWEKFHRLGKIQPALVSDGARFRSIQFGGQWITKTKEGYTRQYEGGKTESFYLNGRLKKIVDSSGNSILMTYKKDGHLEKLIDNFNRKMFFTFNENGLLSRIDGEADKTVSYSYNPLFELVSFTDSSGHVTAYEYDALKHHNLTRITYDQKTVEQIDYYGQEKRENVKKLTDAFGVTTLYDYKDLPDGTSVSIETRRQGKVSFQGRFEYHMKRKINGDEWLYKFVSSAGRATLATTYDEACGLPLSITKRSGTANFIYDSKCRLLKKVTPKEITALNYHPASGKVNAISLYKPASGAVAPQLKGWSKFEYDEKGRLKSAENSARKKVVIVYDLQNRISTLMDQDRVQMSIVYDEVSRPVKITDSTHGSILIEYDGSGAVKSKRSQSGGALNDGIFMAYQNLLAVIAPVSVPLSF